MQVLTKRVYEPATPDDGFRVLIDRLWPRGLSKEKAAVDLWDKDVAPSDELRTAFHHGGMSWPDFEAAYRAQLADGDAVQALREQLAGHDVVTLLYGSRDEHHNQAVVLRELLQA